MLITIIGTGNIAFQLAQSFTSKLVPIDFIIGRNDQIPSWLLNIHTQYPIPKTQRPIYTTDYSKISPGTDLIIIAVSDDAIVEVAQKLSPYISKKTLVVHTSGSVPSTVLKKYCTHFGALYPLQTFTKNFTPDFETIPIFYNITTISLEKQNYFEQLIIEAARLLSPKIFFLDDADRLTLHIAAIFVNNFTNHLFGIAKNLLSETHIPFEVLLPLIRETVKKIEVQSPEKVQTGPAVRGDIQTIEKHLAFLSEKNNLHRDIYKVITDSIRTLK